MRSGRGTLLRAVSTFYGMERLDGNPLHELGVLNDLESAWGPASDFYGMTVTSGVSQPQFWQERKCVGWAEVMCSAPCTQNAGRRCPE